MKQDLTRLLRLGLASTAVVSLAFVGLVAPSSASATSSPVTITRDSDASYTSTRLHTWSFS